MAAQSTRSSQKMSLGTKIAIAVGILTIAAIVVVGALFSAIAVPGLMRARIAGNEASAIGTMRAIGSGQAAFSSSCANGLFARSLSVLGKGVTDGGAGFISEDIGRADRVERGGYICWIEAPPLQSPAPPPCNGAGTAGLSDSFVAKAEPVEPGQTGQRYFATTESGTVYQSDRPITFRADHSVNPPAIPLR